MNGLANVFGNMAKGNPANPLGMAGVNNVFAPFDSSVGIAGMPAVDGRKKRKKHVRGRVDRLISTSRPVDLS